MIKPLFFALLCCSICQACLQSSNDNAVSSNLTPTQTAIDFANAQQLRDAGDNITKAVVRLADSSFSLRADMRKDHRFFGFQKPDTLSKKLLLFSIFTDDVEGNPFGLELGAYYDTDGLSPRSIQFLEEQEHFIAVAFIDSLGIPTPVFFQKEWIAFEDPKSASLDHEDDDDNLLHEFGLVEHVEDGTYPFFIVTLNFVERNFKVDFDVNIENLSIDVAQLYDLVDSYASIAYTSELENNLIDINFEGKSLLQQDGVGFGESLEQVVGILNGAAHVTTGDLPGKISIIDSSGESYPFDLYVDDELVNVNGKLVTAFYEKKAVNTIVELSPASD